MWITDDVELPDEVVEAHVNGELVLFVGAGASLGKPSNLPLYEGLAKKLGKLAAYPFSRKRGLDYYIGSLESLPSGFDAHQHALDIISNPKSKHNPTHSAVVSLAESSGAVRIVTTNYDDHLAAAATAAGIAIPDRWDSPALPLGRSFTGLVHLHGSVRRPKSEMVLTDRDFGQAYMTDAWAARFLLPMFASFTVLFVGYSHDDAIMRYLALGLPSRIDARAPRRFALTSSPDDSKWEYLGITPIGYTVTGKHHGNLVAALTAWDQRARMGQTDHQAKVRDIVPGGPALRPTEHDYLVSRLRTSDGARDFVAGATGLSNELLVKWLQWLEDLPEFKALFARADPADASLALAHWFSTTFIATPELHGAALQTVQRLGQTWSAPLFNAAVWASQDLAKKDEAAGTRWETLVATSIHGHSAPVSTRWLLPYEPFGDGPDASVLRAALRPFLTLGRRWSFGEDDSGQSLPDVEVAWTGDEHELTANLLRAVEVRPASDPDLGSMLEDALSAAYGLLDSYHGPRRWDPLSFGRSSIAPHQQDDHRDGIDAIVDALRVYGEKALPTRPDLVARWWSFDRALFRRLALHLLSIDASQPADSKLTWLLDKSVLYDEINLKHEVYEVLAAALPSASSDSRARLLAAAIQGPERHDGDDPENDRHFDYTVFNLLVWLTRADPAWTEAESALAEIQGANPSFAAREHPDFNSWMTSGTWGDKLPMEPEEFIQQVEADASSALTDLLSRDYSERNFEDPDWSDALRLVSQAVGQRASIGLSLWDVIDQGSSPIEHPDDLKRAVIDGWAKAEPGDLPDGALDRISSQISVAESARKISGFLLEQVRSLIDSDESPPIAQMRRMAVELWDAHSDGYTHHDEANPVGFAPLYLNSWPGELVQFWMLEIDRRWRHHRDDWSGLNDEERSALDNMLAGSRQALDAVQPALAGQLFFIFGADERFAIEKLLPLFDDPDTAVLAWNPYLHHARYNDKLLAAGLLDSFVGEWDRLDALGDNSLQFIFYQLVVSIVSFAGISTQSRKRLLDQSVLADNGAHAPEFAEAVARFIREDGVNGAEVWRQWLGKHIENRLNGIPRTSTTEELARWADIVPAVGEFIPVAVASFSGHNIGLGERFFNREFPDGALQDHGPVVAQHFAERVRHTTSNDFMVAHRVQELVGTLRAAVGDAVAQPVIDAARERGFLNDNSL